YTIMQYFILCPHCKAFSLLFAFILFKFGRHQVDIAFIICWTNNLFKNSCNTINYTRWPSTKISCTYLGYLPLANFDFFFPLTRCALSFFLCLEFIHIGYCPCCMRSSLTYLETEIED
uniref:Uncharacterized protein n=1 Tax=Falco tinnunculus TaxID=100819 RepID=A0A8C4XN02_FALTI